jgi:hypothetical protein
MAAFGMSILKGAIAEDAGGKSIMETSLVAMDQFAVPIWSEAVLNHLVLYDDQGAARMQGY